MLRDIRFPTDFDEYLHDSIMHGERYDATLEKLPKRHDPILFWARYPRVHGTPIVMRRLVKYLRTIL
jgi:hypothetical protein